MRFSCFSAFCGFISRANKSEKFVELCKRLLGGLAKATNRFFPALFGANHLKAVRNVWQLQSSLRSEEN